MLVSINGQIINIELVYQISEVDERDVSFTIHFIGGTSLNIINMWPKYSQDFRLKNHRLNFSDPHEFYKRHEQQKKIWVEKIEKTRQELIQLINPSKTIKIIEA